MMPELGKRLVHEEGLALVREWIAAMKEPAKPPCAAPIGLFHRLGLAVQGSDRRQPLLGRADFCLERRAG